MQTLNPTATDLAPDRESYLKLAEETETMLREQVLRVWFPRSIDRTNGGFYENFTREWNPAPSEGKFSVFQGRMTWLAAQIAVQRPDLKEQYLPVVRHGLDFLSNVLWDKERGGFFWGLDDRGKTSSSFTDGKHLYGMSFGLYGAAAAFQATQDQSALELARKCFHWMDQHAHDAKNGGYFEWLTRDGQVVTAPREPGRAAAVPAAGFPVGFKSMNTHIHLLESFTQLYEVWPDALLRQRILELRDIVRDRICVEPGAMNLYFTNDWKPIPDHDSYGHDIETAYLLIETESVLKISEARTERMAKLLVEHALAYGWDDTYGGFFREGTTFGPAEDLQKEWWVQFEGLNALLLMHEKNGQQTDKYFRAFQAQWRFLKDHQVDHEYGGVYDTIERDGTVKNFTKARMWKEGYHESRALLNVTARLRALAARSN